MIELKSTPVIISSCDAYQDAWEAFFALFFRYWPDCRFPLYLITNDSSYPDDRVISIKLGEDQGWASNMRRVLAGVDSDYLIYMQEDYFLCRPVDNERIISLLHYAISEKAACLRLYPSPAPDKPYSDNPEVGKIALEAPYRVSLQAAIWNKHILNDLIVDGESSWEMEIKGTVRSRSITTPFLSVKDLQNPALPYIHRTAIFKGRWTKKAIELCHREGIQVDFSKRPLEAPPAPSPTLTSLFDRLKKRFQKLVGREYYGLLRRFLHQYVDAMVLRRQKSFTEDLVFRGIAKIRPHLVASRREKYHELIAKRRVAILAHSDLECNLFRRLQWGDYWAQYELTKALGELGYLVTNLDPDVVIHLFGTSIELPPRAFKIIWIHSHPERITPEILSQYDRISCASSQFTQKIRDMGFDAEWAPAASALRPSANEIKYDIVFVGNARMDGVRQIIQDLGDTPYNLKVWGKGWDKVLPARHFGGRYVDYPSLGQLYSSALISLNDHWPEMAREGFVSNRPFDILASGGFCISDANPGINELFGDAVPQYHSAAHLRELVDYYINNPEARRERMQQGRSVALSHTWQKRAQQFLRGIDTTEKELWSSFKD